MSIRNQLRCLTLAYAVLFAEVAVLVVRSLMEPRFGDPLPDYARHVLVAALIAYPVGLVWMWRIAGSSVDEA